MAKISFNKLNLNKETKINKIDIQGNEVEVKEYLPIEEKLMLIETVVEEASEGEFINPLISNKLFDLYFVYKYTNISFPDSVKKDENSLYDVLEKNKVFDAVTGAAAEDYKLLFNMYEEYVRNMESYRKSFYGALSSIITKIPKEMSSAVESLEKLDTSKLTEVMGLAKVTSGTPDGYKKI